MLNVNKEDWIMNGVMSASPSLRPPPPPPHHSAAEPHTRSNQSCQLMYFYYVLFWCYMIYLPAWPVPAVVVKAIYRVSFRRFVAVKNLLTHGVTYEVLPWRHDVLQLCSLQALQLLLQRRLSRDVIISNARQKSMTPPLVFSTLKLVLLQCLDALFLLLRKRCSQQISSYVHVFSIRSCRHVQFTS